MSPEKSLPSITTAHQVNQPSKTMDAKSPQLIHTWDLIQAVGKPHSVVRVRNLQTSLIVGTDAWGRKGKNQPVLISASASLRNPFESASSEDAVTGSTIHYGIMSKAILGACKLFSVDSSSTLR